MTPENRNNTTEIAPYDQLDLFTEFEQVEAAPATPNPQTVRMINESIRSGSQQRVELERAIRESSITEERLEDQGVTNRIGARAMTGSEVSRQALEDIVDKETVGGSPYLRGKRAPGSQLSKKRRYVSSRDRMLGDVAPEHIRRHPGY